MWAAELLSKTLAVCWEWALLTTVSGLVPEDRIELTPSGGGGSNSSSGCIFWKGGVQV